MTLFYMFYWKETHTNDIKKSYLEGARYLYLAWINIIHIKQCDAKNKLIWLAYSSS